MYCNLKDNISCHLDTFCLKIVSQNSRFLHIKTFYLALQTSATHLISFLSILHAPPNTLEILLWNIYYISTTYNPKPLKTHFMGELSHSIILYNLHVVPDTGAKHTSAKLCGFLWGLTRVCMLNISRLQMCLAES